MNDLISRQEAIDAMCAVNDSICGQQAIDAICELPSAQPEIIRCKDCIYFDKGYDEDTADWCHAWSETTSEDGYCHNAERGEVQEWKT